MRGRSIGQVAHKAGIQPSAIRYYEQRGLLSPPTRVNGRRQYDDKVLERLAMVRFATHVGFSIAETKLLLDGVDGRPPPARWRKLARDKAAQVEEFIAFATKIRNTLLETIQQQCPMLVERGQRVSTHQTRLEVRAKPKRRDGRQV